MAKYMTQTMSSPNTTTKTYYRKQSSAHPSHGESSAFTRDAKANYARFNNISPNIVEEGTYRSNQGKPDAPNDTFEI